VVRRLAASRGFLLAGIFGFLINPLLALYYMQGLNTKPVHGHTALFGVYGMLGSGLMPFVLGLKTGWSIEPASRAPADDGTAAERLRPAGV
jgi:nitric oxide reductase large subunit